jgi:PAS domain S-box-containing protein
MTEEFATLGLTKREREILGLAIQGKTDKEIAASLLIGTETVKSLWERLRSKLGAKNRSHAIAILFGRAQIAQATELNRASTILATNLIGVVVTDAEGRICDANDVYLDLTGYTRKELVGKKWIDLAPPEQAAGCSASLAEVLRTGRMSPSRSECVAKSGERIPVLVGGFRLEGAPDRAICYLIRLPNEGVSKG